VLFRSEGISIYSTVKNDIQEGGFALLGKEAVRGKWGVDPARIGDILALTGDSSDNIPGVPGIGGKTATALINEHGSLSGILENPAAIANPKLREKLATHHDLIQANREMVRLDDHLALPEPWKSLEIHPRHPELIAALRDCEFKTLLKEIEDESGIPSPTSAGVQGELF
jgi:DNA polymerase-1